MSDIIQEIRAGNMVVLMDDEHRENEGDLIMAADRISAEHINFMVTHARGLVCLTLTQEQCQRLHLPLMSKEHRREGQTHFTYSIEAAADVTTGISCQDRATTIRAAISPEAHARDVVSPGHVFPIMARLGGVLERAGHTEAGCDLARLAGCTPAAVIVEILNPDGTMARRPQLEAFVEQHQLKLGTIADLIQYRLETEQTIHEIHRERVETCYGDFECHVFLDSVSGQQHAAFVKGECQPDLVSLVRVHVPDPLLDVVGILSERFHRWRAPAAFHKIAAAPRGVMLMLNRQEPIDWQAGLAVAGGVVPSEVRYDQTVRTIGVGSQILRQLGVGRMALLGSGEKYPALSGFGLEIVEHIPCQENNQEACG